eukprot:1153260-Pelagomonas_calceolata.AAC.1
MAEANHSTEESAWRAQFKKFVTQLYVFARAHTHTSPPPHTHELLTPCPACAYVSHTHTHTQQRHTQCTYTHTHHAPRFRRQQVLRSDGCGHTQRARDIGCRDTRPQLRFYHARSSIHGAVLPAANTTSDQVILLTPILVALDGQVIASNAAEVTRLALRCLGGG